MGGEAHKDLGQKGPIPPDGFGDLLGCTQKGGRGGPRKKRPEVRDRYSMLPARLGPPEGANSGGGASGCCSGRKSRLGRTFGLSGRSTSGRSVISFVGRTGEGWKDRALGARRRGCWTGEGITGGQRGSEGCEIILKGKLIENKKFEGDKFDQKRFLR